MAELYLLPCACGQKVQVGRAQAGQTVACPCGQRLNVPTLRGLRDLEAAPIDDSAGESRRPMWSPWHGAAFSGGLAVAAVALVLGATNLYYYTGASFFTEDRSGLVIEAASGEVDQFSPLQALEEWNTAVKEGLSHVHTPTWILAQESARVYRWRTIAFFTLGFSALVVAVGAVFLGRRR